MKLSKIYSNKNFKNIEFNDKFNVVIAFIESKEKKDTHKSHITIVKIGYKTNSWKLTKYWSKSNGLTGSSR